MRKRDRDMIRSIATRDKPGTSDPAVMEALADAEMQFGDQIPTGTYLDMTANLPVVHPEKVLAPVLLVRGEYDGIAPSPISRNSITSCRTATASSSSCPAPPIRWRWPSTGNCSGT
jgi:hypothetical protein